MESNSVLIGDDANPVQTSPRTSISAKSGVTVSTNSNTTIGQEITIQLDLERIDIGNIVNNTTNRLPKNRVGEEVPGADRWDPGTNILSFIPENDPQEEY